MQESSLSLEKQSIMMDTNLQVKFSNPHGGVKMQNILSNQHRETLIKKYSYIFQCFGKIGESSSRLATNLRET